MDEHALEDTDFPDAIEVRETLDLHGFFPEQIPEIMEAFLENALELGLQELRVVHGKGKSRLKFEVRRILEGDARVSRFNDAPPHLGGWGATVILLKTEKTDSDSEGSL